MAKDALLERIGKSSDILIGVGIITILVVMLMPMPTPIIDFLLTINFLLAFVIVLVPIYIGSPSEFTVFPGLLLVVTLFRLSLNVATTRLILGEAQAGRVIEVFGAFTIRGNYIVGIIIFLILILINFMVITKGSGRVAEVTARFTLDAMPGKQMAIDADLNNGVISEKEAEEKRDAIRREADFYGAMDGASKFVKGDAVAGLIITFLNIIAGIVIGMVQKDFTFSEALEKYTILTVGDGLVTQIPALLISSSAGIIVTRSGTRASLGKELTTQLMQEPKVLYISGAIIMLFAFAPGMPWYFFAPLSLVTIGLGYMIHSAHKKDIKEAESQEELGLSEKQEKAPDDFSEYLQVDPLELEIGYSLISYVNEEKEGDLLDRISSLRKEIALEIGILIPPFRIRDNIALVPNQYIIKIRGEEVANSECLLNHYLALDSGSVEKPIKGIKTKEPAFEMPALWITEDKKEKAEMHGYTVIEPPAMIATHISEIIKSNAENIITRQDVQNILDNIKKNNEAVVNELVPNLLSVGNIEQVIKNLLHERVPIRDMVTILETLADYAPITRDIS
ncbi:MAG: flagellar biosynthesis protein FlhA, partial [Candidatus Cloacimonadota bacterium]|nr:flagellar biosynthesis protein FlhA [Candidatus Cloacimonadota bacterium]